MRRSLLVLMSGLLVVLSASIVFAGVYAEAIPYKLYAGYATEGPFRADADGTANDFFTFCVERTEYFYPGTTDYEFRLPVGNANKSSQTGRILTGYAAFVYNKFLNQDLTSLSSGTRDIYQKAIWAGMVGVGYNPAEQDISTRMATMYAEIGKVVLGDWDSYSSAPLSVTVTRKSSLLGQYSGAEWGVVQGSQNEEQARAAMWAEFATVGLGWNHYLYSNFNALTGYSGGINTVTVLNTNVYIANDSVGANAQDMLASSSTIPDNMVPEPVSLIVWSLLGCLGLGLAWRRRRKAA